MDRTLVLNDVYVLNEELYDVCDKFEIMGKLFKLSEGTLDAILQRSRRSDVRFSEVLTEFVRQDNPRPTWRIILDALNNPLINNPRLAEQIEKRVKHLKVAVIIDCICMNGSEARPKTSPEPSKSCHFTFVFQHSSACRFSYWKSRRSQNHVRREKRRVEPLGACN